MLFLENGECLLLMFSVWQIKKMTGLKQKKAHLMEIQVNGGSVAQKWILRTIYSRSRSLWMLFSRRKKWLGVTEGKGYEGVVTCWGVTRLPRKTHRGLRMVACIGAWHPPRVSYTVGQNGIATELRWTRRFTSWARQGSNLTPPSLILTGNFLILSSYFTWLTWLTSSLLYFCEVFFFLVLTLVIGRLLMWFRRYSFQITKAMWF